MKVGMIGFGRLGRLVASHIAKDFELYVYDKVDYKKDIKALKAKPMELKEIGICDIVIPFVPISAFESIIKDIVPHLKEGALLIDVCSVKEHPIEVMKENLPEHIQILGTHPMFGPDSAKDTLFGTKIALCPEKIDRNLYNNIKFYLQRNGIKTVETTAEQHDREIAHTLVLTHVIGRTLVDQKVEDHEIDTKGYRRLLKILQTVENDSWQLFEDMNNYNKFSKEVRESFKTSLNNILTRLEHCK